MPYFPSYFFLAQVVPTTDAIASWGSTLSNVGFAGLVVYLIVYHMPGMVREFRQELALIRMEHAKDMEALRNDQLQERRDCATERRQSYDTVARLRDSVTALLEEIRNGDKSGAKK